MSTLKDLLKAAMDLETQAHALVVELEKRVSVPVIETDGITTRIRCVCGQPIEYHDKYCRECGRMQEW